MSLGGTRAILCSARNCWNKAQRCHRGIGPIRPELAVVRRSIFSKLVFFIASWQSSFCLFPGSKVVTDTPIKAKIGCRLAKPLAPTRPSHSSQIARVDIKTQPPVRAEASSSVAVCLVLVLPSITEPHRRDSRCVCLKLLRGTRTCSNWWMR
ncbi:hypothetical protein F4777DRAFT_531325 [Nemania sp. FL0916]|nr:hypothetical protein F4777DRAFT_531325 [Nemania sp. FL0916]